MKGASALELEKRRQGYSQDYLARAVHERKGVKLSQWKLSQLERGLHATEEERRAIAGVLGVSESHIFPIQIYGYSNL